MGNICRSPLAECVFLHKINQRGVADRFMVDSAGTGGWHAGEPADARMRTVASAHGITINGRARQVRDDDFRRFDYIICMDDENRNNLLAMGAPPERIALLLEFDTVREMREVPDPYYGEQDGFELVYSVVDRACEGLMNELLTGGQVRQP